MKNNAIELMVADDVVLVQVTGHGICAAAMAELFCALAEGGVHVDLISLTAGSLSFSVFSCDFSRVLKATAQLKHSPATMRTSVQGGYSKITLRSSRLPQETGVVSACFQAISEAEADTALVSASDTALSVLVRTDALDRTLARLEEALQPEAQEV